VAWICCTFLGWDWTAEQSPPRSGLPQVIMQWSVGQDCSKCTVCGLNLLYIPELTFHSRTVTTMGWIAPGKQPATSTAPDCKSWSRCCYLH
jgi:hypothetical protein